MSKELKASRNRYESLQAEARRYTNLWTEISKFVAIRLKQTNMSNTSPRDNVANDLDFDIDDPTAAISVNQHGDFLAGVIWGTGDNAITLTPSRHVDALVDPQTVMNYYQFVTKQVLYHINHASSGFSSALRAYCYDQASFGTSGISAVPNPAYPEIDDHALLFQAHGVDSMVVSEGGNGLIDTVYLTYWWDANRIVREFCTAKDGSFDKAMFAKLPKNIQGGYERGDTNTHQIVWEVKPRDNFKPKLKGKRGARFTGVWFLYSEDTSPLRKEDYKQIPIAVARAVKIRGEVYGRAYGTILLSAIRGVNYMLGTAYDTMDKMHEPALGAFSSAIMGDNVLDSSAGTLTVLNPTYTGAENPVFPLYTVGDPSALIQFAIPFLNDKIAQGFKLDALLDLDSSGAARTATESLQRLSVRAKSMSGILAQQETELVRVLIPRVISILEMKGELGVDPQILPDLAAGLVSSGRPERVIPEAVLAVMTEGKAWYNLEVNTDLRRMSNSEKLDKLLQVVQIVGAGAQLDGNAVMSVDVYTLVREAIEAVGGDTSSLLTREQYEAQVQARAEQAQQMQAIQAQNIMSQADRNEAHARLADRKNRGI